MERHQSQVRDLVIACTVIAFFAVEFALTDFVFLGAWTFAADRFVGDKK